MTFPSKLCIYHGGCDDGFGAAFAMWRKYPDTEFYPGVYQQDPPDVTGRDVFLVDFSYKRPVLEHLARQAHSLTILDHHKTAMENLIGLDEQFVNVDLHFDMNRSGAMITWEFFHGRGTAPEFIRRLQDRDLWRNEISDNGFFVFALRSYPQNFSTWWQLSSSVGVQQLIEEGKPIYRYYRQRVEELKRAARPMWIGEYLVPCANAPYAFASEVAGELAEGHKFGACYYINEHGHQIFSLRSRGEFDVSEVAKSFGGGGHRNAAGFRRERPIL